MSAFVPLVSETTLLAIGAGVLVALLVVGYLSGDDWQTQTTNTGGSEDIDVCPRCHHRTPGDATRCPECGKSQ